MAISTVGIIGAGQMGKGIAQVFAIAGFDVILHDNSTDVIATAKGDIADGLAKAAMHDDLATETQSAALGRITATDALADLASSDLIIETAIESESVKQAIFREVIPLLSADTILASNTSSISITRLAAGTDRPEKFMGMHFMNPVPRMQLVELIRGIATSETTFDAVKAVILKLGKVPVAAEDFPAFAVNRILMPMINEAIYTVYEGVGTVESIDISMKLGAHHPMGPLELADFIGLDICLANMNALDKGLADNKYRPCPLLTKYVEAGWLGRKSGRGFYDYRGEKPVPTR